MRRVLFLIPLVVCGCRAGRQGAVSSDGRVASTIDSGTFISGRGKVAEGGEEVAWSPDGQTLAIAADGGLAFWPKGEKIPGLGKPFAWSPFGDQIAATTDSGVRIKNLLTGESRSADFTGKPNALRWTADGHLLAVEEGLLQLEGVSKLDREKKTILDATPAADGTVTWLETDMTDHKKPLLDSPMRLGHWNPVDGAVTVSNLPDASRLFGLASPRKMYVPIDFALAPDGTRIAAAAFQVETSARSITRLKALATKANVTKAESAEAETILKAARISDMVVRLTPSGQADTLWSSPILNREWEQTDLSWSPDGKWLAIARKDGTVRVAAQ